MRPCCIPTVPRLRKTNRLHIPSSITSCTVKFVLIHRTAACLMLPCTSQTLSLKEVSEFGVPCGNNPECHASLFSKNKNEVSTNGSLPQNCEADGRAVVHTIHHVDHFSRKLRRRLTQRTLLEAKALKQQSEDLLHTLIQLAELLARDPKAVKEKAMALWVELSKNEPENQARPTTLEQLLVMLTRESARRMVHLANHVSANVAKLPHYLTVAVHDVVDYTTMFTDMLLRTCQLDKTRDQVIVHARLQMLKLQWVASEINTYANQLLYRIDEFDSLKPWECRKMRVLADHWRKHTLSCVDEENGDIREYLFS
uniref:Uncharacterized protein n=1 Tax=Timema tahoe TaxID=61484 RepID=A0A7R9IFQ8_9NEOP|nr:unnamed protein product [Timema tahoe]